MYKKLSQRIDAAMGRIECDLLIKNAKILDVFGCRFIDGEVAIHNGTIVGIESGLKAKRTLDAKGTWLVPGFIDAHVHLESSMMTPESFEAATLKCGTTSAICDPHELANVLGIQGIEYFLEASQRIRTHLQVMMSSCVPATHLETNGGGTLHASDLAKLMNRPGALGLAEVMNMPGVIHGDESVLEKIQTFYGRPIDGHAPMMTDKELSAYASAGISSCHESSELSEAREKLTKGLAIWIREGSVAKDLDRLISLLTLETSTSMGFCTDDRNPLDIAEEGHVDHLVRRAIQSGVKPEVAYRTASWSVARHYGLNQQNSNLGLTRRGAIAPGYEADLVWLRDSQTCSIHDVFARGQLVSELSRLHAAAAHYPNTIKAHPPEEADLQGPHGRVNVIGIIANKILTEHQVRNSDEPGVCQLSVLERYGHGQKPANGYVSGFGVDFDGAIASSVGHDSHNLIVAGSNTHDMQIALKALIESGGGFSVVGDGKLLEHLALPFGGLMSPLEPEALTMKLKKLKAASRAIGCQLAEPFLQLAFLSLPVIPSLKLTDKGLVDVNQFKIIDVRAS